MRVAGYVDEGLGRKSLTAGTERGVIRAQHLGSLEDIPSILDRNHVDEVILALPSEGHGRALDIASWCRSAGVPFRVVPDLLQLSLDRVQLDEISGVPILSVREASIRGTNAAIKRAMDALGALVLLVVLAVPMAIGGIDHPASNRRTHFLPPRSWWAVVVCHSPSFASRRRVRIQMRRIRPGCSEVISTGLPSY